MLACFLIDNSFCLCCIGVEKSSTSRGQELLHPVDTTEQQHRRNELWGKRHFDLYNWPKTQLSTKQRRFEVPKSEIKFKSNGVSSVPPSERIVNNRMTMLLTIQVWWLVSWRMNTVDFSRKRWGRCWSWRPSALSDLAVFHMNMPTWRIQNRDFQCVHYHLKRLETKQ